MARQSNTLTPALLDFWATNGFNVIFEGRRGVGKTAVVKDCFDRLGLKWKYFSAATMDPWCDFVGIPRAVTRDGREVLEYVMPPDFADDKVEALFFDEFNRSHKKIRDAVMELIQFKSINGREFKNLKIVWAAINPKEEDDEQYQVEDLDPAQLDRFHVYVKVPYRPDRKFFESVYERDGSAAVDWWNEQPTSVQSKISPRRLEYAIKVVLAGGNPTFVFDQSVDSNGFVKSLKNGSITDLLMSFVKDNDTHKARAWLQSATNVDAALFTMKSNRKLRPFVLPLLSKERLTKVMSENQSILKWVIENESSSSTFSGVLDSVVTSGQNKRLSNFIVKNRKMDSSSLPSYLRMVDTKMKGERNTYGRIKLLVELCETLEKSQSVPKTVRPLVESAITTFVTRSQTYTITSTPYALKRQGYKAPKTYIVRIHKVFGEFTKKTTTLLAAKRVKV